MSKAEWALPLAINQSIIVSSSGSSHLMRMMGSSPLPTSTRHFLPSKFPPPQGCLRRAARPVITHHAPINHQSSVIIGPHQMPIGMLPRFLFHILYPLSHTDDRAPRESSLVCRRCFIFVSESYPSLSLSLSLPFCFLQSGVVALICSVWNMYVWGRWPTETGPVMNYLIIRHHLPYGVRGTVQSIPVGAAVVRNRGASDVEDYKNRRAREIAAIRAPEQGSKT
jgi:hypothetical protein